MSKRLILTLAGAMLGVSAQIAAAQYYGHEYEGTQAPIREGEQAVIPLDTGDPSYNAWKTPRDDLRLSRRSSSRPRSVDQTK